MIERVIVTGGAGFIGSAVVRFLLKDTGCRVLNLDKLTYAANLMSLAEVQQDPRYIFVKGDINDRPLLRSLFAEFKPDLILHLAAESHVDRSIDEPATFVTTNVLGTFSMLHEALNYWQELSDLRRSRFRFCHVSTDEVFGALGPSGAFDERPVTTPIHPMRRAKQDRITWHAPGTARMGCLLCLAIAAITTARTSFRKN